MSEGTSHSQFAPAQRTAPRDHLTNPKTTDRQLGEITMHYVIYAGLVTVIVVAGLTLLGFQ